MSWRRRKWSGSTKVTMNAGSTLEWVRGEGQLLYIDGERNDDVIHVVIVEPAE